MTALFRALLRLSFLRRRLGKDGHCSLAWHFAELGARHPGELPVCGDQGQARLGGFLGMSGAVWGLDDAWGRSLERS